MKPFRFIGFGTNYYLKTVYVCVLGSFYLTALYWTLAYLSRQCFFNDILAIVIFLL